MTQDEQFAESRKYADKTFHVLACPSGAFALVDPKWKIVAYGELSSFATIISTYEPPKSPSLQKINNFSIDLEGLGL